MFLERPAPAEMVRGFAGADGRDGVGAFVNGDRWNASAAFTGALIGNEGEFDEQTGYIARLNGLVLKSADYTLHTGVTLTGILNPADTLAPADTGSARVRVRERPELRVDATRMVDTGGIGANGLTTVGYELGATYKNLLVAGEYFDKPFSLKTGGLGAWEIAARYSTLDLNFREGVEGIATPSGGVRGGEQDITTLGLNFYPNNAIRFLLDYQWVSIDRLNPKNMADSGSPVGVQIGQDYQAVALRTQLAF